MKRKGCSTVRNAKTYTTSKGYRKFKDSGKSVHRWVKEKQLGRSLKKGEVVHHKDGNPSNNARSNLVVCRNQSEHMKRYH